MGPFGTKSAHANITFSDTAVLSSASQSSTYCGGGYCDNASSANAIDENIYSSSMTEPSTGLHWLRVDMSPLRVHKVELRALTRFYEQIEVTLYWGGAAVGACESFSGRRSSTKETLTCDTNRVVADSVKLTVNSIDRTYLRVAEMTVSGERYFCLDEERPSTQPSKTEEDSQDVFTANLYNASQSSACCVQDGFCFNASFAIDGNMANPSCTDYSTGLHWLRVDMSPLRVHKVKLTAMTKFYEQIEVTLYWGGAAVGACESHSGKGSTETLTFDNVVADSVKLTVNSTKRTRLAVAEITVSGELYYDLDGGTVKFSNATQSSTRCSTCNKSSTCYNASSAIDDNMITYSLTEYTNGTTSSTNEQSSSHWLRVSMSPGVVGQVVVKAGTDGVEVGVELFMEDVLVKRCQPHPGDGRPLVISCGGVGEVIADSLKLTVNSDKWTDLYVWDIRVSRFKLPNWVYVLATGLGLLGLFTILANIFVIGFYQKKRQEAVPLMYIMIAICDSITGFVAVCHSVVFTNYPAVAHILKGGYYWNTKADWFIVTLYVILQSGTRTSLFYNTLLTAVRTINITLPFHLIKKLIVILSAVVYPVLTVIAMIIATHRDITDTLSTVFMVFPGVDIAIDKDGKTTIEERAFFMIIMMIIPLILPTIIVIICAALQIFSILKPSTFSPTTRRERSMTITIILLTMVCMICNLPYTVFLLYECAVNFEVGGLSYKMLPLVFYSLCTLLPFMQALLNPAILLIRGAALRTFVLETISTPFTRRNADGDGIEMQVVRNRAFNEVAGE